MTNEQAIVLGAHCMICPLRGEVLVPPTPAKKGLRLIIVGEGPGRVEENLGAPFLGRSGKLLDVQLRANGITRSECHVTNTAMCRGETDKDNEKAAECCSTRLLRELSDLPPAAPVLLLGKAASVAVLGVRSIMSARGFVWRVKPIDAKKVKEAYRKAAKLDGEKKSVATLRADIVAERAKLAGRMALPTLHPMFILRSDVHNPIWKIDMARVGRAVRGELALENAGKHDVGGLELLKGLGPEIVLDLETSGIDTMSCDILCVGLSDGKRDVVLWPWQKKWGPKLAKFLGSRKKVIGHNLWSFDTLVLRAHGIIW